jgi:NAD-dependent DNA ligase
MSTKVSRSSKKIQKMEKLAKPARVKLSEKVVATPAQVNFFEEVASDRVNVCFTGQWNLRPFLRLACLRNGYNLEQYVTERTAFLIQGDPHPGGESKTKKLTKAENLKIQVISICAFEDIV